MRAIGHRESRAPGWIPISLVPLYLEKFIFIRAREEANTRVYAGAARLYGSPRWKSHVPRSDELKCYTCHCVEAGAQMRERERAVSLRRPCKFQDQVPRPTRVASSERPGVQRPRSHRNQVSMGLYDTPTFGVPATLSLVLVGHSRSGQQQAPGRCCGPCLFGRHGPLPSPPPSTQQDRRHVARWP